MKCKKIIYGGLLSMAILLGGCSSNSNCSMVNQISFDLNDISEISISYDEENISFFESDEDELLIQEYMSDDKESYYAKVNQKDDSISISEGGKPFFSGDFNRYIKVYLPSDYKNYLKVTTTDGEIDFSEICIQVNSLYAESTSGKITINESTAENIHLATTSGKINCDTVSAEDIKVTSTSGNVKFKELNGKVNYTSTSGSLTVDSAKGCGGSYKAENSGKLKVNYDELNGDLYMFNKNDSIDLKLPEDLSFEFEATTKNGSVHTSFDDSIKKEDRTAKGEIGNNPSLKIELETRNGDINVE